MNTYGKVLLLNGSPHKDGTTYKALNEIATTLDALGIEAEIIHVCGGEVSGCTACGACKKLGKCIKNDLVNEVAAKLDEADGIILASPVYYASPNGSFLSFLDRLFYSSSRTNKLMKVGASVAVCRRGGASATFDVLNKYFTISGMPVVSSNYWNSVHGKSGDDAYSDLEGMQTMRSLARNMAYLIRAIKEAKESIPLPEKEEKIYTNYIR